MPLEQITQTASEITANSEVLLGFIVTILGIFVSLTTYVVNKIEKMKKDDNVMQEKMHKEQTETLQKIGTEHTQALVNNTIAIQNLQSKLDRNSHENTLIHDDVDENSRLMRSIEGDVQKVLNKLDILLDNKKTL